MSSANTIIKNGYKIKISRKRTHITTYENLVLQTTQPIKEDKPKKIKPSIPSQYADFNYYQRQKQRKNTIKELAYNNFEFEKSVMLSLTFDRPMLNLEEAHKHFNLFIKRVNDHYNNFCYVATFSRQTNGNWHYHVLANFSPSLQNSELKEMWKNGITYISYFGSQSLFDTAIKYLIDNMTSVSGDLKRKHGYLSSRNLERDKVVTSYKQDDIELFDKIFPLIQKANNKIMYETKNHLGIVGKNVDEDTGEVFEYHIPERELDEMLKNAGYENWETIYTHLTSSADFSNQFKPITAAAPKVKKFKRKKSTDL